MGDTPRLGDVVSLGRIALSVVFLVSFRPYYGLSLLTAVLAAVLAQISDHADGYLVRRYSNPTVAGWVFDSLADRAFYLAAILAFERELGFSLILVWLFMLRELWLYGVRVIVGDFHTITTSFRFLTLVHAGIVRAGIAVGCIYPFHWLPPTQNAFLAPLAEYVFWFATVVGYLNLIVLLMIRRSSA